MTGEEAITYGERKKARIQEKICRDGSSYGDHSIYYSEMEFTSAALSALQEQEQRRWIPVADRLPEPGERVLATDGGFVGEFYLNSKGQWKRYNVNDYSLLMALDILWWMQMPEPPEPPKEGTP